jgi:hypothetical protein
MSEDRNSVFNQLDPSIHPAMPRQSIMAEFGLENPVESVPLPSNGLVYPEGSVLYGRDSIEIRAMTAKDEDILTSRALIKKGTVITTLLNNCIVTPGVNSENLLSSDRNAVMVALRITGYGSKYNTEVQCPACDNKSKQDFDLSELEVKRLETDPVRPGCNEFEFLLPRCQKRVRFKLMTGRDEQEILQMQEKLKKFSNSGIDSLITQRLQNSIVSVENITDKSKIQMFVQNLSAQDSRALRSYMDKIEPGVDMSADFECPHCNEVSKVRLPMGASFFWPDSE